VLLPARDSASSSCRIRVFIASSSKEWGLLLEYGVCHGDAREEVDIAFVLEAELLWSMCRGSIGAGGLQS
jgi:hypothetical protein